MSTTEEQELDKSIEDILVAFDLAEASPEIANILAIQSRIDPSTIKAKASLKALLSQHTQRARVEELQSLLDGDKGCICQQADTKVCDHNWSLCNEVRDRIAQLSSKDSTNTEQENVK